MTPTTVIKTLPKAWTIAGQAHTEVELREPTVADILEAEKEANPALSPNGFNVAMACQTLVRVGTFTGPFVPGHFKGLGVKQWAVIREAMQEAEALGEA